MTGKPYKVGIFKKSLHIPKAEIDPLDELLKNANDSGIGVNER